MDLFNRLKKKDLHLEIHQLIYNTLNIMRKALVSVTGEESKRLRERKGDHTIRADQIVAKAGLQKLHKGLRDIIGIVKHSNEALTLAFIVEEGLDRDFVSKKVNNVKHIPHLGRTSISDILSNDIVGIMDSVDGSIPFAFGQPEILGVGIPPLYAIGLSLVISGITRYGGIWVSQPSQINGTFIVVGLEGPDKNPKETIFSKIRRLDGTELDFCRLVQGLERPKSLNDSFIVTHFSRTDQQARAKTLAFLKHKDVDVVNGPDVWHPGLSVFCLNSGLIALLSVIINGSFAIIPSTHIWDIAPVLPLLEATGCIVSTIKGEQLNLENYSLDNRLSIVAASSEKIHEDVIKILKSSM